MKKAKPKTTKKLFFIIADGLRFVSSYTIIIFVLCYAIGVSGLLGLRTDAYFKVALLVFLSLLLLQVMNKFIKLKSILPPELFRFRSMLFAPALSVVCYYIINHQNYYFYLFLLIAGSLFFTVISFFSQLKPIWDGTKLIKKDTVIHFVFLYIETIFTFALLYTLLHVVAPDNEPLFDIRYPTDPFLDFLYFSVITVTTVGYGDINPITPLAKILVTFQAVMGYLLLSIMLGLMISWLERRK